MFGVIACVLLTTGWEADSRGIHNLIETVAGFQWNEAVVFSPFQEDDRQSLDALRLRIVGRYGDYRTSYRPGHLHAGIDLKGDFKETVYSIGEGEVLGVYGRFPNRSIVIGHTTVSGTDFFSVYAHLEDIRVIRGDRVDENTALGRLFTEEELVRADFGTPNHVHLEIRTSLEDDGRASTHSTTREELDRYCVDPWEFFRQAFSIRIS